ncbi:hypothetical protein MLD38_031793 [Melastoma candidum]|uniref:Uncharacterized protein n=1 Tax=Melastoma candidum TaxID=119954 RepID=A0ACB9MQT8_9MYRT|nr:hypothetical protein MLD38_031793 [Melastoma candidum]
MGKQKTGQLSASSTSTSPVGMLEDFLRSSGSSTDTSTVSEQESRRGQKHGSRWGYIVGIFSRRRPGEDVLGLFAGKEGSLKRSTSMRCVIGTAPCFMPRIDPNGGDLPWKHFGCAELQSATNNFSKGKGGYAEVYRGCLQNGKVVAVKRLTRGTPDEKIADFLAEVGIMAHVAHRNTAKLVGYGVEGGMHLVLELSPNGSLASWLYGLKEKLEWQTRYRVALGTAEGLLYLHEGCPRRIVHRDIKAANILLTRDFEPQICDFGLAKWLPEKWTHLTVSKFEGTFGYLAPEYMMHGIVDEKTDVFAFGVLLLELVSGRRALDYEQRSLVIWAKPLLRKSNARELIDASIAGNYDTGQLNLVVLAASLCLCQSSIRRPSMSQVLQILKGDLSCLKNTGELRTPFFRKILSQNPVPRAQPSTPE